MSHTEKKIILFLALFLAIGAGARLYRERQTRTRFWVVRSHNAPGKEIQTADRLTGKRRSNGAEKREDRSPTLPGKLVPLNRATVQNLVSIPSVGPALAREIVEHRARHGPFKEKHDLLKVKRMTISLYLRIAPHVVLN